MPKHKTEVVETRFVTREAWLQALAEYIRPWYEERGVTVPPVRIGVGYTSKGARSKRIGECWHPSASADGVPEVFIHPSLHDPTEVAATLVHELIHAGVGIEAKHGPGFKAVAVPLGLQGKMTATYAGPDLLARLVPVLDDLGPYPQAAFTPRGVTSTGPKQTTRMVKVQCETCGYLVRTSQKWLDVAVPDCPVDLVPMEVAS